MAENSPKGGTYILTALRWRRRNENGTFTIYRQGDEVELSDVEAARRVGRKFSSFREKVKEEKTSPESETPSTTSSGQSKSQESQSSQRSSTSKSE